MSITFYGDFGRKLHKSLWNLLGNAVKTQNTPGGNSVRGIEMLISNSDYVKECIVYNDMESGKDCITAKIVYNKDFSLEELRKKIKEHIDSLNERLISYKQIKKYDLTDVEMEKTTTLKIKRWTPAPKTQVTV